MHYAPDAAREIVGQAYRWILGREADAGGLETYSSHLQKGEMDPAALRALLLGSVEFRGRTQLAVVECNGTSVVVDPFDNEFGTAMAKFGAWEPMIGQTIEDGLPVGGTFIDIGANVGVMTLRAARKVGDSGRVVAFEPNPGNVDKLLRGVVANGFENVTVYPMAASDRAGVIFTSKHSNGKVVATTDPMQIENAGQAVRVDDMVAELDRVDFVKLDIEGFEVQALRGLAKTLARHRPTVLCEFNPLCLVPHGGVDPRELADLVFSMTDRVTIIHGDEILTEATSASNLMEVWTARDAAIAALGHLPLGWTHFDLLFKVR